MSQDAVCGIAFSAGEQVPFPGVACQNPLTSDRSRQEASSGDPTLDRSSRGRRSWDDAPMGIPMEMLDAAGHHDDR